MKYLPIAALGFCLAGLGTPAFARDGSLGIVNSPAVTQAHPVTVETDTIQTPVPGNAYTMMMHATPSIPSPTQGMDEMRRPAFVFSPVG